MDGGAAIGKSHLSGRFPTATVSDALMGVSSNAKRATRVCAALIAGPISSLSF
jgi:hypothetical protein